MPEKYGTVVYMGKTREIWVDEHQWSNIRYSGGKFWIHKSFARDNDGVNKIFDDFCRKKLSSIIDKGISRLRGKEIDLYLDYTDGTNNFKKNVRFSVDSYLKEIGYSSKIDYKIGNFEYEWGINEIDTGSKTFVLYFNLNLIKYDSGMHIDYVVAHELAHVFHRDHGDGFNDALEKLFPSKQQSEYFFNFGIVNLFGVKPTTNYFLVFIGVSILSYLVWSWLVQWFGSFVVGVGGSSGVRGF